MPLCTTNQYHQLRHQVDTLLIKTEKESHVVVLGGTPLDEPMVERASYVMNTEEQVQQVMKDYQNGKMGEVEGV